MLRVKLNGRYRSRERGLAKCIAIMADEELFPCIITYDHLGHEHCESVSLRGLYYGDDDNTEPHACDLVEELHENPVADAAARDDEFVSQHAEGMIRAWVKETGNTVSDAVMVVSRDGGVTRIFIEPKGEQDTTHGKMELEFGR